MRGRLRGGVGEEDEGNIEENVEGNVEGKIEGKIVSNRT
jgi:hypothetical protein